MLKACEWNGRPFITIQADPSPSVRVQRSRKSWAPVAWQERPTRANVYLKSASSRPNADGGGNTNTYADMRQEASTSKVPGTIPVPLPAATPAGRASIPAPIMFLTSAKVEADMESWPGFTGLHSH